MGAHCAWANPLFVMEGGYAVEEIGINAVNVLGGSSPMNILKSLLVQCAVICQRRS